MRRCVLALVFLVAGCGAAPSGPSPVPTVPLPTDPRFDLAFYRQLTQNDYDVPGKRTPLKRLTASPSIYLQRTGLSDGFVAQLEQTAREVIPALTGNVLTLAHWETGTELRFEQSGWILVTLRNDPTEACGAAAVGLSAGHIWLNTLDRCGRDGEPVGTATLVAHELGHALGFYHVDSGLMHAKSGELLTDRERYHGAVAYTQALGSAP